MDLILVVIIVFLLLLGIIGSFAPIIPGPLISYGALFMTHFYVEKVEDQNYLWLMAFIVVCVTLLDFLVQIYGVKKFGGGNKAVNGSIIGLILGFIFLPGFGIILGPFFGAFIGAKMEVNNANNPIKIAIGALAGFVFGSLLKLSVSLYIVYTIYLTLIRT